MKRGDRIEGGWYVGTTPFGVQWVAYRWADFVGLCACFDRRYC